MSDSNVPFDHSWQEDVLRNIGSVTVGGTPRTSVGKYWNGDVPWMVSGDVHLKRITDVPARITDLGLRSSNATLVDPPTVAVSLAGQGKTRGTAAFVLCRLCTNQSVALIKCSPSCVVAEYLFYNLEFRYEELRSRSAGEGRAGLSKKILEEIPIPLPPLSQQVKIAEILSEIDRVIEQTRALIDKQKRIKIGLMQDLLTRGIDEHGNLRTEQTHKFKDSPLGRIPEEWIVKILDEILILKQYGISTVLTENQIGISVLRMNNLIDGEINYSDLKYSNEPATLKLLLDDGDVLFNRTNSIDYVGRTAIYRNKETPASFASYLIRLVPDLTILLPEYLNLWLNDATSQVRVKQLATIGVQQANINPTNLGTLMVAIPESLDEQKMIVDAVLTCAGKISKIRGNLVKLVSIKKALMQDLLTGSRHMNFLKIA